MRVAVAFMLGQHLNGSPYLSVSRTVSQQSSVVGQQYTLSLTYRSSKYVDPLGQHRVVGDAPSLLAHCDNACNKCHKGRRERRPARHHVENGIK